MKYVLVSGGKLPILPGSELRRLTFHRCDLWHWQGRYWFVMRKPLNASKYEADATTASSTGLLLKTIGLKVQILS